MKFLLAILLIAFLFWLPWDQITTLPGTPGLIPDTGGGAAVPAPLEDTTTSSGNNAVNPCGPRYFIQQNDTLRQIAARCGLSLEAMLAANPQIYNPEFIEEGQVILIPTRMSSSGAPVVPPTGIIPNTGQGLYMVQEGDSLSTIATRSGITLAQLLAANPQITNPNVIYAGQQIVLPNR